MTMSEWVSENNSEILIVMIAGFMIFFILDALWKFDKERRIKKLEKR